MKKRIISLLTAALLLIGMLPVAAFAAENKVISGTFTYMPAFVDEPATEPFYYSDSWFAAPSTEENTHLLTMSAALAYASMEAVGSSYIKELYGKIGYGDIQTEDMDTAPTKNTIGTAIAHKRIDGKEVVAVSIRGNKYSAEWASNVIAGVSGNIEGFDQASQKVIGRIRDYIAANGLESVKLWIAGYSRAGSVADLTGVYINEHLAEFGTSAEDVSVYTFEAPRCCASDKQYPNIYCVRNKNDLITYLYPASWGLFTNGREIIIGSEKQIRAVKANLSAEEMLAAPDYVTMEDFSADLIDYLSKDLTREKYSDKFENTLSMLLEIYFNGTSDAFKEIITAVTKSLVSSSDGIMSNPRLKHIAVEEVIGGIMQHNSDAMYRQLADELVILLQELAPVEKLSVSEEEYQAVLDRVYPLLRFLGPVLINNYLSMKGVDADEVLPEGYDDPDYDPQTADPKILTYDQYMEAQQDQSADAEVYSLQLRSCSELNLYHIGTLAVNFPALIEQHFPQTDLALITALDPLYTEKEEMLFGDVDGDGKITISDATLIQKAAIDLVQLTDRQKMLSDVNGDGRISILDVTCVQKYIAEYQTGYGKTGTVCG